MAKMILHDAEARRALSRGVGKLAAAVESTLGPKGMNAMVDRPIGTPIVSRDGVTIASEIELPDRFENMGAQVVREVSMQTNEVAGDGTTTAMVLANGLIQNGVAALERGAKPVDLCRGIDKAVELVVETLKDRARPATDRKMLEAVATIAATDPHLGSLVAEALHQVGLDGIVASEYGLTIETTLDVVEGMSFDRGYISHHMVTDVEKMEVVLHEPYILLTDLKVRSPQEIAGIRSAVAETGRTLVIVAEEISPEVVVTLLGDGNRGKVLVVNPPDYGHWRKAMMDDLAIITGGKVIARDLGGRLEDVTLADLGTARQVRASARETVIVRGGGKRGRDRRTAGAGVPAVRPRPAQHRAGQAEGTARQAVGRHRRHLRRRRDAGRAEAQDPAHRRRPQRHRARRPRKASSRVGARRCCNAPRSLSPSSATSMAMSARA